MREPRLHPEPEAPSPREATGSPAPGRRGPLSFTLDLEELRTPTPPGASAERAQSSAAAAPRSSAAEPAVAPHAAAEPVVASRAAEGAPGRPPSSAATLPRSFSFDLAASSPETPEIEALSPEAPHLLISAGAELPPSSLDSQRALPEDDSPLLPVVRTLRFPERRAASEKPTLAQPATRFSASVSRSRPRADSEPPEVSPEEAAEAVTAAAAPTFGPGPEDLSLEARATARTDWPSDTPTAGELLLRTRRGLQSSLRDAGEVLQKSTRGGAELARRLSLAFAEQRRLRREREGQNDEARREAERLAEQRAVEERLAAEEAAFRAQVEDEDEDALSPAAPEASAPLPARRKSVAQKESPWPLPRRSETAGKRSTPLGTSPGQLQRLLPHLKGPLAAAAAATLVYLGSHTALSAAAPLLSAQGPRVPDLGSLPSKAASKAAPAEGAAKAPEPEAQKKAAAEPPAEPRVEAIPMPDGLHYPGKGVIEVVTGERELIYVDGVFAGRGPLRRIPVVPGPHEVAVRSGGSEQSVTAHVEAAQGTRALFVRLPEKPQPPVQKESPDEDG